jgi:transcriptional regulator with XRE-family HTH domain
MSRPLRQLARIRRERRLSQAQLAARIRRSRAFVSLLERGYEPRTKSAAAIVLRIANALAVPPAWLEADSLKIEIRDGVLIDLSATTNTR